MQAQVSMLIKHHQLMWKHDADPSSPSTASSASTHKPCDQCGLKVSTALSCAEHQCKHNWVTLAAYGGWLHLMIQTLWLMCTGTTAKYVPSSSTVLRCAKTQCMHKSVCSQEANYLGLDYPCPDIEEFFNSIFDDQPMVEFVQRLLGYGITGHTRPETQASQGEQWRGKVSASGKSVRMYT